MPVVAALVFIALTIIASAFALAWRHGSLHPSEQERIDLEFERMLAALSRPGR